MRSELHERFRRNHLEDVLAGGAAPSEPSYRGAQLWVRTARFAYTAYLLLDPANQSEPLMPDNHGAWGGTFRLVDETLYDLDANPEESDNIAYDGAQALIRERLLDLCLRDWKVRLRGPRSTSRRVRSAYLRKLLV